jgi:hypothetical protein
MPSRENVPSGAGAKRRKDCSLGAGRILGSVSLWSNEEARSADKIIAWAVRPRETIGPALKARWKWLLYCLEQYPQIDLNPNRLARYLSGLSGSKMHRAFSAGPLGGPIFLGLTAQAIILSALRVSSDFAM